VEVPNAKFMPQYRGKNWNGEIHLYDMRSKQIYVGLLDKIVSFCKKYGYSYKFEDNKFYGTPYEENEFISFEGVILNLFRSTSHDNTKSREYSML
jgi:hypothetical protein